MGLTHDLAAFVAETTYGRLPAAAIDVVCLGFTDCVGTMVAGRSDPAVRIAEYVFLPSAGEGDAHLYLGPGRAPAPTAALLNGTAAHVLDYDDVALLGHPSAALVPAILAEAQELDVSGEAMVAAYVAGYEVWAELLSREGKGYRGKGWHPTAVFGSVAAAAACASLRGLTAQDCAHALAIAASRAGGLSANFGSMTKPLHVGQAAQSGVVAARLASAGMTGSSDVFEHPQGFLSAISPSGGPDREAPARDLGVTWRIVERGLSVKRYPVCYGVHRLIDAVLDLRQRHVFDLAEIDEIDVEMSVAQDLMVRHRAPETALQAKFSAEFAMAAALVVGQVGLAELTDAFVQRQDVRDLIARVRRTTHETYDPDLPDYGPHDSVRIRLKDGRLMESDKVRRPRGHVSNPLTSDELRTKFRDCVADAAADDVADGLFDILQRLPALASARNLSLASGI